MKILFIGDIFAKQGVLTVQKGLSNLKNEIRWDYCIANGENAAAGKGINGRIASELYDMGVDGITLGNHVWARDEILYSIDSDPYMARPANYSKQSPGRGRFILDGKAAFSGYQSFRTRIYAALQLSLRNMRRRAAEDQGNYKVGSCGFSRRSHFRKVHLHGILTAESARWWEPTPMCKPPMREFFLSVPPLLPMWV